MLLQPFIGALLAMRAVTWEVVPALACVLLFFMIREPLLVVARQQWVWKTPHPEVAQARKQLLQQVIALGVAGGLLMLAWPWWLLVVLGAGGAILTALAVYVTLKNRQRSIAFQVVSATALSSSCVPACWAVLGQIPQWCWWWWALHAAHFLTGILVVHTRLDARIAARMQGTIVAGVAAAPAAAQASLQAKADAARASFVELRRHTSIIQWIVVAGAVALAIASVAWGQGSGRLEGRVWYAAALLVSAVVHFHDLKVADRAEEIARSMTSVGKRALALSIVFTVLLVVGL